jgi:hypothetical protein
LNERDLLELLERLIELEIAMSKRRIRVGREHFFAATALVSKALQIVKRGRR